MTAQVQHPPTLAQNSVFGFVALLGFSPPRLFFYLVGTPLGDTPPGDQHHYPIGQEGNPSYHPQWMDYPLPRAFRDPDLPLEQIQHPV